MVSDIFEKELRERSIFKDLLILSPHYVPEELPHRDTEIRNITKVVAPVLRNEKPDNLFIYGKTGTGKTVSVKYVLRKLEEFVQNPKKNSGNVLVKAVYMNCKVRNSRYQVFLKILEDDALNSIELKDIPLSDRSDRGLKGMDPADLYERLLKVVQENNLNLLVVLDEIDMITKNLNDVVYLLTRINDEISSGSVSIIGISNDARFKNRLDPRSKSTLCEEERLFKPYNALELKSILKQRIAAGFQRKTIGNPAVSRIAAFAAEDGDARYALKLLRKSGELAQDSGNEKVMEDDVGKAKRAVEKDIMAEAISTLPEHQQIVMYSVASLASRGGMYKRFSGINNGDLFTGEVYEAYESNCSALNRSPRTMRQFSEYLNELEMLGLLTVRASGKGVRGTTRLIRLGYPPQEIKDIVRESLGLEELPAR